MRIHEATGAATIDHYEPKATHQELAYEWSNFRLCANQINANKGQHEDVLDPFRIESGWFVLRVGSFDVVPADGLDPATRARVEATILRLRLNEPTFRKARQEYHDRYHGLAEPVGSHATEPLPLAWLRRECPYVAFELERQGRLRTDDVRSQSVGHVEENQR